MHSVLEVAASRQADTTAIGTLNEGALHAQLKDWYRRRGDCVEQVVDGFVVDLVRGNLLVEVQTGSSRRLVHVTPEGRALHRPPG